MFFKKKPCLNHCHAREKKSLWDLEGPGMGWFYWWLSLDLRVFHGFPVFVMLGLALLFIYQDPQGPGTWLLLGGLWLNSSD